MNEMEWKINDGDELLIHDKKKFEMSRNLYGLIEFN